MWIKKTKLKNKEYIQITKSFRIGKSVKHKVILNLGRSENLDIDEVKELIDVLQKLLEELDGK